MMVHLLSENWDCRVVRKLEYALEKLGLRKKVFLSPEPPHTCTPCSLHPRAFSLLQIHSFCFLLSVSSCHSEKDFPDVSVVTNPPAI